MTTEVLIWVLSGSGIVFGAGMFGWGWFLGSKRERIRAVREWQDYRDTFYVRAMQTLRTW